MMSVSLYIRIFFATNGLGPYACFFCDKDVTLEKVHVHHFDHNHSNNDSKNLVASHWGCHSRHHALGAVRTPESCAKQSATMKGRPAHNKGVPHSVETRAKISAAGVKRFSDPNECAKISAAGKGRVVTAETRAKISAGNKGNSEPSRRGWETRRRNKSA